MLSGWPAPRQARSCKERGIFHSPRDSSFCPVIAAASGELKITKPCGLWISRRVARTHLFKMLNALGALLRAAQERLERRQS